MAINVNYNVSGAAAGNVAQGAGYGQYAKQKQQYQLQKLQAYTDVMAKDRAQGMQAQGMAADQAARQQQLAMQAKGQALDAQARQQQLALQGRGQDMDFARSQQQQALAARGQDIGAQERQQALLGDIYKQQVGQQGQFTRDWLQGQNRLSQEAMQGANAQALEAQREQGRQDLFEKQFTTQQNAKLAEIANGMAWIDENSGPGGQITADQAAAMKWQLQQAQAGIKPQSIPKPKQPSSEEVVAKMTVPVPKEQGGGWWVIQKDGTPKFQMPPKPEPDPKHEAFGRYLEGARKHLTRKDPVTQETIYPDEDEVRRVALEDYRQSPGGGGGMGPAPARATPPAPQQPVAVGGVPLANLPEAKQKEFQAEWAKMSPAQKQAAIAAGSVKLGGGPEQSGQAPGAPPQAAAGQPAPEQQPTQPAAPPKSRDEAFESISRLVEKTPELKVAVDKLDNFTKNDPQQIAALPPQQWNDLVQSALKAKQTGLWDKLPDEVKAKIQAAFKARATVPDVAPTPPPEAPAGPGLTDDQMRQVAAARARAGRRR